MNLLASAGLLLSQAASQPSTAPDAVSSSDISAAEFWINLSYTVAAILFVFGLKMMSSPRTARQGNLVGAAGMALAILVTLFGQGVSGYVVIVLGGLVGTGIGYFAAVRVPMTGMPEMVALFNGSGGLASTVVALAELWKGDMAELLLDTRISIALSVLIGMVTFTGSVIAYGKLAGISVPLSWMGKVPDPKTGALKWAKTIRLGNPLVFPFQHPLNIALLGLALLLSIALSSGPMSWQAIVLFLLSGVLGVLLTMPIGGADMPVVVSLLNSYSGMAACAAGFVLHNKGLIISGSLVGASGLILTHIMCVAMNRSLLNVIAGGFGSETTDAGAQSAEGRTVRKMDAEEAAMVLDAAQKVFIIPGYGMAVAQAQHTVAELAAQLAKRDIEVKYGVHPVAGRMPGHMNVLLAEANVPYEQLSDLELNSEMEQCDVALVVGANDVVNPDARRQGSQIYGMPIFDVDKARTVMVSKRSLNPGFAGIENPLFFNENTTMLFGDAKKMLTEIVGALKTM